MYLGLAQACCGLIRVNISIMAQTPSPSPHDDINVIANGSRSINFWDMSYAHGEPSLTA